MLKAFSTIPTDKLRHGVVALTESIASSPA
jgi:hypothetical protein